MKPEWDISGVRLIRNALSRIEIFPFPLITTENQYFLLQLFVGRNKDFNQTWLLGYSHLAAKILAL